MTTLQQIRIAQFWKHSVALKMPKSIYVFEKQWYIANNTFRCFSTKVGRSASIQLGRFENMPISLCVTFRGLLKQINLDCVN